mmetsp:Transcript_129560/g.375274  ORF Transcript_129560/g.375274 Transcript_129560/m.375274 type:complete len:208 (+) Transcript_129560:501-1124(+)
MLRWSRWTWTVWTMTGVRHRWRRQHTFAAPRTGRRTRLSHSRCSKSYARMRTPCAPSTVSGPGIRCGPRPTSCTSRRPSAPRRRTPRRRSVLAQCSRRQRVFQEAPSVRAWTSSALPTLPLCCRGGCAQALERCARPWRLWWQPLRRRRPRRGSLRADCGGGGRSWSFFSPTPLTTRTSSRPSPSRCRQSARSDMRSSRPRRPCEIA